MISDKIRDIFFTVLLYTGVLLLALMYGIKNFIKNRE